MPINICIQLLTHKIPSILSTVIYYKPNFSNLPLTVLRLPPTHTRMTSNSQQKDMDSKRKREVAFHTSSSNHKSTSYDFSNISNHVSRKTVQLLSIPSTVKSRWLCYFVENTSICLKFYFVESRSSLKIDLRRYLTTLITQWNRNYTRILH